MSEQNDNSLLNQQEAAASAVEMNMKQIMSLTKDVTKITVVSGLKLAYFPLSSYVMDLNGNATKEQVTSGTALCNEYQMLFNKIKEWLKGIKSVEDTTPVTKK